MSGPEKFHDVPAEKIINLTHINSGGFGDVFKGDHVDWGITVAVKLLRDPTGQTVNRELVKEVRVMHHARFDYIERLYGIYKKQTNGVTYLGIVMEYLENGSLDSLLKQVQPLPLSLQFRILHEVALGMNYLHGLQPTLLHLDLKTSNVLLDENFHVRLTDFGLSKWKQTSTMSRQSSTSYGVGGTLAYKPPEALTDLNYKPQQAFDSYSYGILIWSVITGQEPYSNAVVQSLVEVCVGRGQRPDITLLPNNMPPDLKDLMMQCWSQDPDKRPHFKACIIVTRKVFEVLKLDVIKDVRIVQDKLRNIQEDTSPEGQQNEHDSGLSGEQNSAPLSLKSSIAATAEYNEVNVGTSAAQESEAHQDVPTDQQDPTQQGSSESRIQEQKDSKDGSIRNQFEQESGVILQQNPESSSSGRSIISTDSDTDYRYPAGQEQPFIMHYFPQLVERLSNIDPILDSLYSKSYISSSEYSIIRSKRVYHDKVRETLLFLKNKGTDAMNQFYLLLQEYDHFLVEDLLKDQG
ncbi:receptor-interacting serine/threonine-protein kinase 2-like [Protopterus annectens]|uniref:receptor-interacting serine/threonine-protein kinase 2-like n=1 Tax=Protopterus annectens TaxID=7888 RepID=UPI001CFACB52|nr:receptor-interacting serine/threonine-protein kinase 2-like [Protopterus annectens]XP_043914204.1 receptor-interacting serine/threonine-protein kinase 2-like [Protopterus annectens]